MRPSPQGGSLYLEGLNVPLSFLERIIMRTDYTKANSKINENKDFKEIKSELPKKPRQKIFISLPMAGREEADILAEIKAIGDKFAENYDVIDSYHQKEDPNGVDRYSGVYYLGHSLMLMRTANLVVFSKHWTNARGCIIEHRVCELYDIPYIEMI